MGIGHAVRVDEGDEGRGDLAQSRVAGGGRARIGGQCEEPASRVIDDLPGASRFCRGIVDDEALHPLQGGEHPLEDLRAVSDRDHDRDVLGPKAGGTWPGKEDAGGDESPPQNLLGPALTHHRSGCPRADQPAGTFGQAHEPQRASAHEDPIPVEGHRLGVTREAELRGQRRRPTRGSGLNGGGAFSVFPVGRAHGAILTGMGGVAPRDRIVTTRRRPGCCLKTLKCRMSKRQPTMRSTSSWSRRFRSTGCAASIERDRRAAHEGCSGI